jgi:hypothetical protein
MSSWQLPTITEHQPHPLYPLTIPMGSLALQDTHTPHSLPDASVSGGRLGEARQQVWFHSAVLWDLPHLFSSVSEAPSLPPLPSLSTASQRSLAGPNCLRKEVGRSVSVGSGERLCVCVFFQPLEVRQGLVTITPLVCDPPAPEIGEGGGGAELMGMFVYLFVLDMIN